MAIRSASHSWAPARISVAGVPDPDGRQGAEAMRGEPVSDGSKVIVGLLIQALRVVDDDSASALHDLGWNPWHHSQQRNLEAERRGDS
jgi:hypothetical protein